MLSSVGLWVQDMGGQFLFFYEILQSLFKDSLNKKNLFNQMLKIIIQSIPTTCFAGFFVGGIMTLQFTLQVKQFGALGYLGGLATSGTLREIGPLLIAFMLSGKVGAYTSAELASMRVTEQIDALLCLGARPFQELIVPRFLAIIFSSFILFLWGLFFSFLGGALMALTFSGISFEEYIRHIPLIVNGLSVGIGLSKCFLFSLILATLCTYYGYYATGGARGVGRAVVRTAFFSMVGIVLMDWLTSFLVDMVITFFWI